MHRRACLFLAAGMAVSPSARAWGQAAEVAGVKVLRGVLNAPAARADAPTRTSSESVPLVELPPPGPGALSDAPASFPGFVEPLSNAVGYGNAFASGAQDVAPAGPVPFVTLFSNFAPFETAYFYVNGVYSNAYNMGPFGRIGIYYASIGAGIYRFEMIGTMSGRRAGAASRVVASGAPAVPALAIAPHAVSNSGTGSVTLFGRGFPPSTSVDIRRDGVFVQTTPVGATGLVFQTIDVPAGAESSHVYSVDAGTPGSLVGQSIEVRADAGTPPIGDQNPARAFFDRSVLSTSGGAVSFLGEGFQPMENVDATGCTTATLPADVDGATRAFLIFGAGSGTAACTLTGQTSGRVARASLIQDAKAMTIPGMIVVPTAMKGAGNMVVQIAGMPPSEMGSFELDGTPFLPLTLDASGLGTVTLPRPTTGGVIHTVGWTGVSGGLGSATLLTLNQPVVSDPGDQTVCLGSMASFNASATAAIGPPPTVQWQVSTDGGAMFSDIPSATTSPYVFTPTAA
ncbi:MAG TPA: hypothetical protein VGR00_10700, partial [Thermoanaerobaculia bacterium]|nr:hypothetical protein [Thermoanaerobaculia bacterium]